MGVRISTPLTQVFDSSKKVLNKHRREEKWTKTNYVRTQPVKINDILIAEVMNERTSFASCSRAFKLLN